jgi:5-methylcytosine-specific restriction endonuclease McrA
MLISEKDKKIWDKAKNCNCNDKDCTPNNHKLCGIRNCNGTILFGAHESVNSQRNSRFSWNIDHIVPKAMGGSNYIENLQAVHVSCNRTKADN